MCKKRCLRRPLPGRRMRAHLSLSLPPAALAREAGCAHLHQRGSLGLRPISRVARQPVRPGPAGGTSSSTGLAGSAPHLARRAPARPARTRRRHLFINGARWVCAPSRASRASPSGQDPPEAPLHQRGSLGLRPISRVARQPVRPGPAGGTSSSTGLAVAAPHLARRAPARPSRTRRRHLCFVKFYFL